jgi:hydrogenase maturation factor HypF (carbamoyltransferase family)
MTVGSQVKQTMAVLLGIEAVIRQYAQTAQNLEAKEVWERQIPKTENMIKLLDKRIRVLERQEPQYKGF